MFMHESSGVVIPTFVASLDAFDARLKGLQPMPLGGLMGFAFAEHVWLEDAA